MKREKSSWTGCFACPKTNSCYLPSGLNELNPPGRAAGPQGPHRLAAAVLRLLLDQRRGKTEASVQGIPISSIQAGQHLGWSFSPPGF